MNNNYYQSDIKTSRQEDVLLLINDDRQHLLGLIKYWEEECFRYKKENQRLNNVLNELKEWFKEFHKYQSRLKWNEKDYIEFIEHLENELKESDK